MVAISELSARTPRTPAGKAYHATIPNSTEVIASPMNSQKKECFARIPAVAGPKAKPAFNAMRYAAKAVTLCPGGTRSAKSALLAGRYNSPVKPHKAENVTMDGRLLACDKQSIAPATENMESTIVLRRPKLSAR